MVNIETCLLKGYLFQYFFKSRIYFIIELLVYIFELWKRCVTTAAFQLVDEVYLNASYRVKWSTLKRVYLKATYFIMAVWWVAMGPTEFIVQRFQVAGSTLK